MLDLKSISPSRIKTFDQCLFKYWLTYNRPDVELKSNFGAEHGSLIHDILENYVKGDKDWVKRLFKGYAGLLESVDKFGNKIVLDSPLKWAKDADFKNQKPYCDICPYKNDNNTCGISNEPLDQLSGCPRKLFDESIRIVEKVIKRYRKAWSFVLRDADNNIVGCEYLYNVTLPSMNIPNIGVMDLILRHNDQVLEIIDYKSGKWTQSEEECKQDIQVRTYSLIARKEFIEDINKKGFAYKNIILTFDYFQGNPITVTFDESEDKETEDFLYNKSLEIRNTKVIKRIVKSDADFDSKKFWKCRSLCDIEMCKKHWNGQFEV